MLIVVIAIFLSALLGAGAIYALILYQSEGKRAEFKRRLRSTEVAVKKEEAANQLLREVKLAKNPELDAILQGFRRLHALAHLIEQTDKTWTTAQLLVGCVVTGVLGFTLAMLTGQIVIMVIVTCMTSYAPIAYLRYLRSQRSAAISRQLPDALDMIVRSLKSGHPFSTSIQLASQEMPKPIATEFSRCHEEQSLGTPLEVAIYNMVARVPNNVDLKIFAVSVVVQGSSGGNINEVLELIAGTIRERFKFFGQMKTMTAEGRTAGMVMAAMPFLVVTGVSIVQQPYMEKFISSTLGQYMALGAMMLWVSGIVWMNRMMKVEV